MFNVTTTFPSGESYSFRFHDPHWPIETVAKYMESMFPRASTITVERA